MEQEKVVFVSDREVSKLLGIARQTLCNWRFQQKGPRYVRSGRLVRYALNLHKVTQGYRRGYTQFFIKPSVTAYLYDLIVLGWERTKEEDVKQGV